MTAKIESYRMSRMQMYFGYVACDPPFVSYFKLSNTLHLINVVKFVGQSPC